MELTALKITRTSGNQDTGVYNQLRSWLADVDNFYLPRPVDCIYLNTESVGKILQYSVVDNKEYYIIYIKNLFRKIQSHKKKLKIFREVSENNFQLISFKDGGLTDEDIFISISLREVRRRVRGEADFLFEKKGNPLLCEVSNMVNKLMIINGRSEEEMKEEYNSRLLESYFLSRVVNDGLTDKLLNEIIQI